MVKWVRAGRAGTRWGAARALALLLGASILALTACGSSTGTAGAASASSSSKPATNITLAESVNNITDLPIWIAEANGYFKQQGLNVKVVVLTTASVTPALVSGSVQFIKDPGFVYVTSRAQGAAVTAIAKMDTGLPFAMIVSKAFAAKYKITSSTPLAQVLTHIPGSNGGSTAAGQRGAAEVMFQSFGLNPQFHKATFATVPAMTTALARGEIDWLVVAQPIPAQIQAAGNGVVVATSKNVKAWNVPVADMVLATSTKYAKASPATAKAMVAAIEAGMAYVTQHPQKSIAIASKHESGVAKAEIATAVNALKWPTDGSMNSAFWSGTLSYFAKAGIRPKGASVATLGWTNQFIPAAHS